MTGSIAASGSVTALLMATTIVAAWYNATLWVIGAGAAATIAMVVTVDIMATALREGRAALSAQPFEMAFKPGVVYQVAWSTSEGTDRLLVVQFYEERRLMCRLVRIKGDTPLPPTYFELRNGNPVPVTKRAFDELRYQR